MFSNKNMENKSFVTVRNTSTAHLAGIGPGGTRRILTNNKGQAMTPELNKVLRSAEEGGVIEIVKPKPKAAAKKTKVWSYWLIFKIFFVTKKTNKITVK